MMLPDQEFRNFCSLLLQDVPGDSTFKHSDTAIDIFECWRVTIGEKCKQVGQLAKQ